MLPKPDDEPSPPKNQKKKRGEAAGRERDCSKEHELISPLTKWSGLKCFYTFMNILYPFILISLKMAEALLIDLHLPDLWDEGGPSVLRGRCTEWGHGTAGQPLLGGVRTAARLAKSTRLSNLFAVVTGIMIISLNIT